MGVEKIFFPYDESVSDDRDKQLHRDKQLQRQVSCMPSYDLI